MEKKNTNLPERSNKYTWLIIILTITVVLITAIILIIYLRSDSNRKVTAGSSAKTSAGVQNVKPVSSLPDMPDKPKPAYNIFNGCPPEGDAGDPDLNRLKNRTDEGSYIPVDFDAIVKLQWPAAVERRHRAKWSARDAAGIARYEGIPVAVEGYFAAIKLEGPESCNCHATDKTMRDFHIWLTKAAGEDRSNSIVVEVSPPVHAKHPNWEIGRIRNIIKDKQKVRISGWLFFDPEHPDQVGKTRGTIWEIHPIMLIEVYQDGKWVSLDNLQV